MCDNVCTFYCKSPIDSRQSEVRVKRCMRLVVQFCTLIIRGG